MDLTVITPTPIDFGVGEGTRQTFADSKWHVDDAGTLHIRPATSQGNGQGNVAAFGHGSWTAVLDSSLLIKQEAKA